MASFGVGTHIERKFPLDEYKTQKILMLKDDFLIKLDEDEIDHIRSRRSEGEVDRAVHDILVRKL